MSLRPRLQAWRKSAPEFRRRVVKTVRQLRYLGAPYKQVSFVFGCQRSGTKMVMRILDNSPLTKIYHENHASAFTDFQLRPDPTLRALVLLNPAPVQVFKPICDSQYADQILSRFPDTRALWIYRHYDDVANSAAEKWGEHQRDVIAALVTGDLERWGWRTALVPESVTTELRRVYRPDLTPTEGALLFWYLRNSFFFALRLQAEPRMRLVRYETLVQEPERSFPAVFSHLGVPFEPTFLGRVRASAVGRREPPQASAAIRDLCRSLQDRLDAQALLSLSPNLELVPPLRSVLLIINTLGTGGAERYVVTVANWLHHHGVAVTVVSDVGELRESLHPGVAWRHAVLRRVRHSLLTAATELRRLIQECRPTVMVTNSLAVTWVARLADPSLQIPVVNIAHGWPAASYPKVGPLMRVADRVVAVSPDVRDKLVASGLPASRCDVVFNGVDPEGLGPRSGAARTAARAEMGAGPDDVLVLIVGRLTAQKAHEHIPVLASRLRKDHPSLRFALVGAGARAEELRALVEQEGVSDRVRLLGLRSDVPDLLGSADIFLSCSNWEGMTLTVIEAMMSGLPVISTVTEGAAQLVDEHSGELVPIGDVAAMATRLGRLAEDPELRLRYGRAGRERALRSFSSDRMVRELLDVLRKVQAGAG